LGKHTEWVLYAQPSFDSPENILEHLARYAHRTAISGIGSPRTLRLPEAAEGMWMGWV
jgi:hypothetical protein